ncbi:efflux RND transporter permease subunit [Thalassoglobus polymorphus]|uniref:Multidrug export protein AcrF n=1 Tax=Thalassoglobus polymorphus TaxID=2527994 RepID=A0A517QUT6_9PLAN|nr:efflux RND transporter permease subunit [Thalassoglobus polymorphus]QDT35361.1 Multidrug export protein AcrF [Thalassoglobus polymorphus]
MNPIEFSCENPVKVAVGVILAIMFGTLAFLATPVQLTPDVAKPAITVTTAWPGASAQEVERQIIDEQEEQLKGVEGLVEFKSESKDSVGTITLEFPVGFDLASARAKVSDKLNQVPEYPEDASEPTITEGEQGGNFIAWIILKPIPPTPEDVRQFVAKHPHLEEKLKVFADGTREADLSVLHKMARTEPDVQKLLDGRPDPTKMRKFAEDFIEARFERVPGISNSNIVGGREQEFRIVVEPTKLAAYQLTIADLRRGLSGENKNTSAGDLWEGKHRHVVRTIGQFDTPEKVANTIIAIRDNSPVYVKDVATVGIDYKKPDGIVRQKGVSGLAINCEQAPGTNVLEIMGPPEAELDIDGDGTISELDLAEARKVHGDCLRIAIAELNLGVLAQQGVYIEQVYDQTDYIYAATDLVSQNIYVGGTLAVLVLLIFLRSPRSVIIVGLSIPISIIASFLFIRGFGRSINVISLAGMAFAVGMVVDNAIVVLENIYRHYQLGETPHVAAIRGAKEVWGAVLASTLTTLAVFVPVVFVDGQAGQLFRDIAIAISCAVGLSLIVSVTVIPAASQRILKKISHPSPKDAPKKPKGFFARIVDRFANLMNLLLTMPGNLIVRLGIVALFVTVTLFGAWILMPKTEYLPEGNRNLVFAILLPPPGYNLDHMIDIGKGIESELSPYWEAEPGSPEAKALDGPLVKNFFFVARGSNLFMGASAREELQAGDMVPVMQRTAGKVPGMFAIVAQSGLFSGGLSGGRGIDVEISGPDMSRLNQIGQDVFQRTMGIGQYQGKAVFPPDQGHQAQPMQNLESTNPELLIQARREAAADSQITTADLGYAINALVDGAYAGDYWHNSRKIDLVIYGADEFSRQTQDLKNLPLSTPTGKLVNVGAVAEISSIGGPESFKHDERQRSIGIQIKPSLTMPLETAIEKVDREIRQPLLESPLMAGGQYQIKLAGTSDELSETRRAMQGNLLLALIITYLLMAALFESFLYPVVIMTSVLLALVGGFAGLALLNLFIPQSLDMLTMLGFVILIGTVVNNAILIVHQSLNYMREDGMSDRDAIVESVRTRIRPIFMSTSTTVLGMLPLVIPLPARTLDGSWALQAGAGSELYRGLGSVVLGGLIISTVFTLILVPVGFSLAVDMKKGWNWLLGRSGEPVERQTQKQLATQS